MTSLMPLAPIAPHVMMMITAKNGAMETTTGATMIANAIIMIENAIIMIDQRDQGLHSYIAADQTILSTL